MHSGDKADSECVRGRPRGCGVYQ